MFGTSGRGPTLKFSSEPAFYLPLVKTSWEGTFLQNYSPFIYGYQLEKLFPSSAKE